jgi:radical SAM protein with 4Fe4S-binding SPASM domain
LPAKRSPNSHVVRPRTKLEDVIPLETPFSLFIEPVSACNFKCKYCLHGDANAKQKFSPGVMDYELYKKLIDSLHMFPQKIKTVHLCFRGEPLLNRKLPDMVSYLKSSGCVSEVTTTTNASLLTKSISKKLINSGLDVLKISIQALSEDKYLGICGVKINIHKLIENIKYLYTIKNKTQIYIKIINCCLGENEKEMFYKTYENYADEIFVENIVDCWSGASTEFIAKHSGSGDLYGREINLAEICPKIFYAMSIMDNGAVVLCGADWASRYVLGNINKDSLFDIWNGRKLRDIQLKHLKFKKDEIDICKKCSFLKACIPDNIDKNADEIIKRFVCETNIG